MVVVVVVVVVVIVIVVRVTTCLENLEISGNLTAVREMSGKKSCQGKVAPL